MRLKLYLKELFLNTRGGRIMNFKKVFLISVNLALYMCLFFGCNNTSDLQTETTTQTQITEKATAEKKKSLLLKLSPK